MIFFDGLKKKLEIYIKQLNTLLLFLIVKY
jgi:hypothetical protein